jgi:hypothetical protein
MSSEIKSPAKNFTANRFFSGVERSLCLQITGKDKMKGFEDILHIQVSRQDAAELAELLIQFANHNEVKL